MRNLIMSAQIENLGTIITIVESYLDQTNCSEKTRYQVCVSVEEVFTNIVSYAYGSEGGEIEFACWMEQTDGVPQIWVRFKDGGIPYNPLKQPQPDFQIPFEDRKIGGLGIYMVREFMDFVYYCYEDGCNILTVGKTCKEAL